MATYKIELSPELAGMTIFNGHRGIILEAEDATDARAVVNALMEDNPARAAWAEATITLVTVAADLSPISNDNDDTEVGFSLEVTIAGGTVNETFTVQAVAGDDFDALMAKMVTALNANANIANAAWSSPTLTLSDASDNLGDHTVTTTYKMGNFALPSVISSITDQGAAGAALSVAMSTGVVAPFIEFYDI